jgi:hypothetical protein
VNFFIVTNTSHCKQETFLYEYLFQWAHKRHATGRCSSVVHPQAWSPFWLLKPSFEYVNACLLPRLSWSCTVLLPSDIYYHSQQVRGMAAKRCMGIYCQYVSAMLLTAISTLADLHSGQRQLFWGPIWICVSVCDYLVIWFDKTTFQTLPHIYRKPIMSITAILLSFVTYLLTLPHT